MTNEERIAEIRSGKNRAENLERLYYDNMPLWVVCLRPFKGLCDYEDLKQQVFLSLAECVKRYDAKRGAFSTFACMKIVQDIPVYLASCGGLSCPASYGKRRGEYRKLIENGITEEREQAERLGVSLEEVRVLATVSAPMVSLNSPTESGEIGELVASSENLEASAVDKIGAEELKRSVWEEVERVLNGRRLDIIKSIYLRGESVAEVAARLGVCPQRVSALKENAFDRLRTSARLESLAADYEYITVYWWRCGFESFKASGSSCIEKYLLKKDYLDGKRRRMFEKLLKEKKREEEEEERKREEWQRLLKMVEDIKKRGA